MKAWPRIIWETSDTATSEPDEPPGLWFIKLLGLMFDLSHQISIKEGWRGSQDP